MSVFNKKGFKRSNDKISIHKDTARMLLAQLDGGEINWSGIQSLRNSDIFTAIDIISKDIASTKIQFKKDDDYLPEDNKILKLFNKRPNEYLDAWHFKYILIANMLLNGNSYVEIVRDDEGRPIELYHMPNRAVYPYQEKDKIYYHYNDPIDGPVRFDTEDVLHLRLFSLDGFTGYSPIYSLANEIGISMGSKKFLDDFFKNGGTSLGIVKYNDADFSDDDIKAMKKDFESSQLKNNSGNVIMLDESMSFERLQIPTEVLNFLNSYKFSTQQVAKAFGLPISKLGYEQTNTSINDSGIEYYKSTLFPIFSMMNAEIEEKLFNNTPYEVDLDYEVSRFIDSDPQVKLQRVTELYQKKIILLNEARAQFGYDPVAGGDEPLADLNSIYLKDLSDYQQSKIQKNMEGLQEGGETDGQQSD